MKNDFSMRDVLIQELRDGLSAHDDDLSPTKNARLVADKLILLATSHEESIRLAAIKEIFDRVDGPVCPQQAVQLQPMGNPLNVWPSLTSSGPLPDIKL